MRRKYLAFPSFMTESQKLEAKTMLKDFSEFEAQVILNEFAERMERSDIRNPMGYLQVMINAAKKGNFGRLRALRKSKGSSITSHGDEKSTTRYYDEQIESERERNIRELRKSAIDNRMKSILESFLNALYDKMYEVRSTEENSQKLVIRKQTSLFS